MKHYTTLIFLLFSLSLSAQFRMVSNGLPSWTVLTDSTYSATINLFSDLTGGSFNGTQVGNTMRMFTDRATIYTVDSVLSVALSQVVIRVKEYGSTNGTPAGQLMIYDPNGQTAVPQVPFGNTGATAKLQAAVDSYNSSVIGSGGGGDVASVNGQTGVVVLDPDDLNDSATTNKFTTASDISKLAGIEAGAQVNRKEVPVILFIGESNSGGQALNSALSAYELSPSEKVQILYDTAFQDLDIGTNNQYLHYYSDLVTQLDPATQHGWENGLRKAVDRHSIKDIYLVKAGQGGSIVADWEVADTFTQIFEQKIAYAEADLLANGLKPVYYIWMSFGINDRLATTDTATWKTDTKAWIERIRTTLGQNATVCMTELPPTSATYNTPIQEISAEDELVHYIPTLDLPLDNDNHWGAVGMDSIAQRMFRVFRDTVWNNGAVIPTELTATAATVTGALTRDSIYQSTAASSETVGIVPTYTLLVNATDSGAGVITFGSGGTTGRGRVTEKIGKDNFIVQWQTGTLAQANTVIVYIDSVSTVASSYARANVSIAGAYTVSTGALQRITAASESTVFSGIAADAYMRIRSSGNNCILSHSPDGVTYTDYYTYTNALLTAPDSLYIKCYQAAAGDGTRFADITINPGASITIPSTETLNYEGFTFTRSQETPESVIDGTFGDQYVDILTGDLYVKKTVSGNTGWEKQEAGTVMSDAEIEAAYNNQVPIVSQLTAEAGISTTVERWTPQRVKQAIEALSPGGSSSVAFEQHFGTFPTDSTVIVTVNSGNFTNSIEGTRFVFLNQLLVTAYHINDTATIVFDQDVLEVGDSVHVYFQTNSSAISISSGVLDVNGDNGSVVIGLGDVMTQSNDGGGLEIINIADPTTDQAAATKAYVDANSGGTQYFDILATGQSNMVNRDATVGAWTYSVNPNTLVFEIDSNSFQVANPILNNISPEDQTGERNNISWQFSKNALNYLPTGTKTRMVVSADGGEGSWKWTPTTTGEPSSSNFMLDSIVNKLSRTPDDFLAKTIIWHQGETDVITWPDSNSQYLNRILSIYDTLVALPKVADDAIMVMGYVTNQGTTYSTEYDIYNNIVDSIRFGLKDIGNRKIVVAAYNAETFDGTHFTNEEIDKVGRQYCAAWLQGVPDKFAKDREYTSFTGGNPVYDTQFAGRLTGVTNSEGSFVISNPLTGVTDYMVNSSVTSSTPYLLSITDINDTTFTIKVFTDTNQDSILANTFLSFDYLVTALDADVFSFPASILDTISGAAHGYSLRRLVSTYDGSGVQIKRMSDSTYLDIGYTSTGLIDTAAIIAFAGASNAVVVKCYDQVGTDDLVHIDSSNAATPIIYDGSIIQKSNGLPALNYVSGNGIMVTPGISMTQPLSTVIAHQYTNLTYTDILDSQSGSTTDRVLLDVSGSSYRMFAGLSAITGVTATTNHAVLFAEWNTTSSVFQLNGTSEVTGLSVGTENGWGEGFALGGTATAATYYRGYIQEVILFDLSKTAEKTDLLSRVVGFWKL